MSMTVKMDFIETRGCGTAAILGFRVWGFQSMNFLFFMTKNQVIRA